MFMKKVVLSALIAAGTIGAVAIPLPGSAQSVEIYVTSPPPPPREEPVPAPRSGHVWTPGHWQYQSEKYVWVPGKFEEARPGYVYRSATWVEREGRWQYQPGRWERQ